MLAFPQRDATESQFGVGDGVGHVGPIYENGEN